MFFDELRLQDERKFENTHALNIAKVAYSGSHVWLNTSYFNLIFQFIKRCMIYWFTANLILILKQCIMQLYLAYYIFGIMFCFSSVCNMPAHKSCKLRHKQKRYDSCHLNKNVLLRKWNFTFSTLFIKTCSL